MRRDQDDSHTEEDELIRKDGRDKRVGNKMASAQEVIEKQDQDIDFLANHVKIIGNLSKQIHSTLQEQAV